MRGSTIQTQQGGNISILGPGGRILVGSAGAAPSGNPPREGCLPPESGNIQIFTDRDVLVAQSRIMTEQGGSILMWSSNGNLDAGEGAKTSVSAPPPKSSCDVDHRCSADIKGDPGALEFQQQSGLSHHRRGHRLRRQWRGSESVAAGSAKQER